MKHGAAWRTGIRPEGFLDREVEAQLKPAGPQAVPHMRRGFLDREVEAQLKRLSPERQRTPCRGFPRPRGRGPIEAFESLLRLPQVEERFLDREVEAQLKPAGWREELPKPHPVSSTARSRPN